jgi:hypothetical protein
MSRDEFLAIEVARYIGLGMDLQAARSLANADWGWADGRTYDMRVAEARERLKARRRQRRLEPTVDDLLDDEFQWDRHSPENQRWHE